MKIKIINISDHNHFTLPVFKQLIREKFDVVQYDSANNYDKRSSVIIVNMYQYEKNRLIVDQFIDNGYYVVFDNLLEAVPYQLPRFNGYSNVHYMVCVRNLDRYDERFKWNNIVQVPMFIWYHDSKCWNNTPVDNRFKIRTFDPTKKFLLLMNQQRDFRDRVYDKFQDIIHQGLFTYRARGISIPGDFDVPINTQGWRFFCNESWYDQTAFSICVETITEPGPDTVFLTEKTFKPIALRHPFMIVGCKGSLQLLRETGFETYSNLFDESYDSLPNDTQRIDHIHHQVKNFQFHRYDTLTREKMEYNHRLFYNELEVNRRYVRDVLDPLMEIVHE